MMLPIYSGVITRLLEYEERSIGSVDQPTPLVIAARNQRNASFLREFIADNAIALMGDAARHGAVLFRGFNLASDADFEHALLGSNALRGMNDMQLSEAGRTIVPGSNYVLHTNTIYSTGGALDFGGFHSENYYLPDVPRHIAFYCRQPPWLGGETGLVDMTKVFGDLPDALRARLETAACFVTSGKLADMSARYGVPADEVERLFLQAGLPVVPSNGGKVVAMYKPTVIEHPVTHERALVTNLSGELRRRGFDVLLRAAFLTDYQGPRWALHRFSWRHPTSLVHAERAGMLVRAPRFVLRKLRADVAGMLGRTRVETPAPLQVRARLGDVFKPADLTSLAASVRNHCSAFAWHRGDLLLVDNMKMAHGGMPGFGPRVLRALICNPMAMPYQADSPGHFLPTPDQPRESLAERLTRAAKLQPAA